MTIEAICNIAYPVPVEFNNPNVGSWYLIIRAKKTAQQYSRSRTLRRIPFWYSSLRTIDDVTGTR